MKNLKVVVNCAYGRMDKETERELEDSLTLITGQKPALIRAKKSVNNFSLRQGLKFGFKITLRGFRALNFLRKTVLFVLPSDSTFKGLPASGLNDRCFNFGVTQPYSYPEIENLKYLKGFNVTLACDSREDLDKVIKEIDMPIKT